MNTLLYIYVFEYPLILVFILGWLSYTTVCFVYLTFEEIYTIEYYNLLTKNVKFCLLSVVLVTGATGFVAAHITKLLADAGEYRLRCTVRSLENNRKLDALKEALNDAKVQPEFVKADLLQSSEEWKE